MSFLIQIKPYSGFEGIQVTHIDTKCEIEIITKGALLNNWNIDFTEETLQLVEANDFSKGWKNFEMNGFRSGKMSPFSCRLCNGKYSISKEQYTIEKFYLGKHALHGILYDALFSIQSTTINNEAATIVLQYDYQATDAGYPFQYSLQVTWTLFSNTSISVQTKITNYSQKTIPMMDGWHPYFKVGANIDDCIIQFSCVGEIEYDDELIPTGRIMNNTQFENGKSLAGLNLDHGFELNHQKNSCTLENKKYKLIVRPIKNYPFLQLYTPPGRNSIAIENLSGAPDCFNNKMGLHMMKPQEQIVFETSYQLIVK